MKNNEMKICQSCAMPMGNVDLHGTNADGSKNEDYCHYCFKDGAFTKDETMDEMIETCVPFEIEADPSLDKEQAKLKLEALFPTLKRWK